MTLRPEEKRLLKRLPEQWRGRLQPFFNRGLSVGKTASMATMLYHRQAIQDIMSWDELLTSLSRLEPAADSEGNLCFRPFLWSFPDNFIETFLRFLLNLQQAVSADSLDRFVNSVFSSEQSSLQVLSLQKELTLSLAPRADSCVWADARDSGSGEREMHVKHTGFAEAGRTTIATSSQAEGLHSGGLAQNAERNVDSIQRKTAEWTSVNNEKENAAVDYPTREAKAACTNDDLCASYRSTSGLSQDTGLKVTGVSRIKMTAHSLPPAGSRLHSVQPDKREKLPKCDSAADAQVNNSTEAVVVHCHGDSNGDQWEGSRPDAGVAAGEPPAATQLHPAQTKGCNSPDSPVSAPEDGSEGEMKGLELADCQEHVQKLREALYSRQWEESSDVGVLSAIPSSQMLRVCEEAGLGHAGEASLPVLVQRLSAVSSKLTLLSSTSIIRCLVRHKYLDLQDTPSRQVMACLSDIATAFPHQLAAVLSDCLLETPCTGAQASVVAALCRELDSSSQVFFLRTLCSSEIQLTDNILTVLQSALSHQPDLNPDLLDCVLRFLETGASPLARNAKYGRLLLNVVRTYKHQVTPTHTTVLQSIISVHASVIRKSLHSALQSCLSH